MAKVVDIGKGVEVGGDNFVIIAGPCAVEGRKQMDKIGRLLNDLEIKLLRGGAFKPRTSPYSFQGLGVEGLKILQETKEKYDLIVVSEIMDPRDLEQAYETVDVIQIGSRNMQNFSLLKEVGKTDKPILLKRGMSSKIEEWLMAAKYIEAEGNDKIILCERGIRTFEDYTRNTLDLVSVPIIKNLSNYPIIIDPSHGTGRWELVSPSTKAALAIGADGVMIEIHPNPSKALSDGPQSLNFIEFKKLIKDVKELIEILK